MENIKVGSDTSSSLHNRSVKESSKIESMKKRVHKKAEEVKKTTKESSQVIVSTDLSYSNQSQAACPKSRKDMIQKALEDLPGNKGTKTEIFSKISELFNVNLDNPEAPIVRTLSQQLCKQFGKTAQEFTLNLDELKPNDQVKVKNPSMKQMIVGALLELPNNRGAIKDIKAKVEELFGETQALRDSQWEMTFAKTFSRHKTLFIKTNCIYQLTPASSSDVPADETLMDESSFAA